MEALIKHVEDKGFKISDYTDIFDEKKKEWIDTLYNDSKLIAYVTLVPKHQEFFKKHCGSPNVTHIIFYQKCSGFIDVNTAYNITIKFVDKILGIINISCQICSNVPSEYAECSKCLSLTCLECAELLMNKITNTLKCPTCGIVDNFSIPVSNN